MISGWWKSDNDSTQPESFRVTSPPHPGLLSVSADIWLMNSVPVSVTVKVTQRDNGIRASPKNALGLPNSGRPLARRVHSAQDRPVGRERGTSVLDPAERSAACDPVVTSTRSSGATETEVTLPPCV